MRKLVLVLSFIMFVTFGTSASAQVYSGGDAVRTAATPAGALAILDSLDATQQPLASGSPSRLATMPQYMALPDHVTHSIIVQPRYPDEEIVIEANWTDLYPSNWTGSCHGKYQPTATIETFNSYANMRTRLGQLSLARLRTAGYGKFPTADDKWYVFYRNTDETGCP